MATYNDSNSGTEVPVYLKVLSVSQKNIVVKWFVFHLQYVVGETSNNSLWKRFWDHFRTDDEGIDNLDHFFPSTQYNVHKVYFLFDTRKITESAN